MREDLGPVNTTESTQEKIFFIIVASLNKRHIHIYTHTHIHTYVYTHTHTHTIFIHNMRYEIRPTA
jgi:hypothetical protein